MTESQIRQVVLDVLRRIAPEVDVNQLDPAGNLREAAEIDSFDFLSLLIGVHERLGVEIPESDYGQLSTLNGLTAYLARRIAK